MKNKLGILTITDMQSMPISYICSIKSCNGKIITIIGYPESINELAKLNGGSVLPEQMATIAGADMAHKELSIDIDGKTFSFIPQWVPKNPPTNKISN